MSDPNESQAPQEDRTVPAPEPQNEPSAPVLTPAAIRLSDAKVEQQMHQVSRRSFLWAGVAVAAGYTGWHWLITRRPDDGIPWPFRRTLEVNEGLARDFFQGSRLAPTFSRAEAREPRANGNEGLADDFDPAAWRLQVVGLADTTQAKMMPVPPPSPDAVDPNDPHASGVGTANASALPDKKASAKRKPPANAASDSGSANGDESDMATQEPAVMLTLEDIKQLPRVEMVTELKCIEGWSTVVQWAGARFADFVAKYPPVKTEGQLPSYVGMETPDGGYYVGLDMESALHPQTLLCYEMNGQPLSLEHGGPLRLVIPVKYGIKNIKRIGVIRFTDERPKDYWAEQGYDWYAGH